MLDVEVLCQDCHRAEHGYAPDQFRKTLWEIELCFRYQKNAPKELWHKLKSEMMADYSDDIEDFAVLMFKYVYYSWAHSVEGMESGWWMQTEKSLMWWRRGRAIQNRIQQRIKPDVREIVQ